jgi:hypothetical protein
MRSVCATLIIGIWEFAEPLAKDLELHRGSHQSHNLIEAETMNDTYAGRLVVATFSERPDLLGRVFNPEIQAAVPEFMRHDPVGALYYGDGVLEYYREYGLVAFDPAEPNRPVARAFSVPFAFCDGTVGRDELPDGGWDDVIRWAHQDRIAGRRPTAVSALEIMVAPRLQRLGISQRMLHAMQEPS